jgi:hypothetical protein
MLISGETRAELTFHHTPRSLTILAKWWGVGSIAAGSPCPDGTQIKDVKLAKRSASGLTVVAEVATVAELI